MRARLRALASVTILVLLVSGCGKKETSAPAAAAKRPLTVVTLNINPTISYAPLMIARDAGFFEQEGIDARLKLIDSNSAMMAFAGGKLDVFSGAVRSGMFNLIAGGKDLQVVADRGHSEPGKCEDNAYAAPPSIADRVLARGGDLRGERFVLFRGGLNEYMLDRLLAKRGVRRDEVEIAQMSQGESPSASQKKFDAIRIMSEPVLSIALARGEVKIIARESEFVPHHQNNIMLYGKRLLVDDPDLGHRFMRAYLRAVRRYNEGKTDGNVAIISRYTKFPPDVIRRACWKTVSNDGMPDLESIDDQLRWADERGYLDADMPRQRWWNPSFLEAANRALAAPK